MAVSDNDKAKLGGFLRSLLWGTADLGFSALPLLKLYADAKKEKVPFMDLLMSDPDTCTALADALRRNAQKLPLAARQALLQALQ